MTSGLSTEAEIGQLWDFDELKCDVLVNSVS